MLLLKRFKYKKTLKDYLLRYKSLMDLYVSDETKYIFNILNNVYYFCLADNLKNIDFDILERHISLLENNDAEALVMSQHLLEILEIYYLKNLFLGLNSYFKYIYNNLDAVDYLNIAIFKHLSFLWGRFSKFDISYTICKMYREYSHAELFEWISLGNYMDRFVFLPIKNTNLKYINEKLQKLFDITLSLKDI